MQCLTALRQWVVGHLQCTAILLKSSRQWNSYNALPYSLGAVSIGTPVMYYLTTPAHWAMELPGSTATLSRGS